VNGEKELKSFSRTQQSTENKKRYPSNEKQVSHYKQACPVAQPLNSFKIFRQRTAVT
jgi:hypothetical protein